MKMNKKDQKNFWKLLEKLKEPRDNLFKDCISGKRWGEHFKGILRDDSREINYPPNSSDVGLLDHKIIMEELSKASYVLKPNKSSGFDSISNEMIKCLIEIQPGLILKLFNAVFDMNVKIVHWAVAMITPIFKSGSKMNPTNYRGISIQSCLGKLFTAILNQRLLKYALEKQIFKDEQTGISSW